MKTLKIRTTAFAAFSYLSADFKFNYFAFFFIQTVDIVNGEKFQARSVV